MLIHKTSPKSSSSVKNERNISDDMNALLFKDLVSPNFNDTLYDGKTISYFFSGRNSCTFFIGAQLL